MDDPRARFPRALLVFNERMKLFANTLDAFAIGLSGFAILRPATEDFALLGSGALGWGVTALVIHGVAHYVLGRSEWSPRMSIEPAVPLLVLAFAGIGAVYFTWAGRRLDRKIEDRERRARPPK